jgi:hypothetical protein
MQNVAVPVFINTDLKLFQNTTKLGCQYHENRLFRNVDNNLQYYTMSQPTCSK